MSRGYAATGKINIKITDTDGRDSVMRHLGKILRNRASLDLEVYGAT